MEDKYMNNNGTISIIEASQLTGKSQTTIYRYIQRGVITCKKLFCNGKQVLTVQKSDIERLFNISCETVQNTAKTCKTDFITDNHCETVQNTAKQETETLTAERIREVIEDFFETKQTQLIKPLEEHALVKYGAISKENEFLKQKLETLLQENDFLREQVKALPGPAELENKENIILLLQKEKEEQIRKAEGLNQVLLDNANNIKELTKERENFQSALKEQETTIREKEKALKNLEELHRAELEKILKQAEAKQIEISEAWKKELELAKRPWWKFW
jgi:hypothetical protein